MKSLYYSIPEIDKTFKYHISIPYINNNLEELFEYAAEDYYTFHYNHNHPFPKFFILYRENSNVEYGRSSVHICYQHYFKFNIKP